MMMTISDKNNIRWLWKMTVTIRTQTSSPRELSTAPPGSELIKKMSTITGTGVFFWMVCKPPWGETITTPRKVEASTCGPITKEETWFGTQPLCHKNTSYPRERLSLSEELVDDRVEQGHVFCAFDGQLVDGVVLDHLGYGGERVAELAEDEATLTRRNYLHVHEATGTPADRKQ